MYVSGDTTRPMTPTAVRPKLTGSAPRPRPAQRMRATATIETATIATVQATAVGRRAACSVRTGPNLVEAGQDLRQVALVLGEVEHAAQEGVAHLRRHLVGRIEPELSCRNEQLGRPAGDAVGVVVDTRVDRQRATGGVDPGL